MNFVGDIRETHAGLPTFEQHTQGHGEMEITEEGWDRNVRTLNYVSFLHKRGLFFSYAIILIPSKNNENVILIK